MHIDRTEKTFFMFSVALIVVFAIAVGISGLVYGIALPEPPEGFEVDPQTVATPGVSPWGEQPADARLHELVPGKEYEVYLLAQTWTFLPNRITIPAGAKLTFYVTSKDVIHGFRVDETNINMMVIPGEVSKLTATFDEPGTYNFVCHEYCGAGHHTMYGQVIVE